MPTYTRDQFAPDTPAPSAPVASSSDRFDWANAKRESTGIGAPAPQAKQGDLSRGISAGSRTFGADMYGLSALVGDTFGIDKLKDFGLAGYERKSKEAADIGPRVGSLSDIHDVGDFFDAASGWLGQSVPSIASSVVGAGAGSLVGRAVAKHAITQLVEKGIEKKAASAAVERLLKDPAKRKLMMSAMKTGGVAGGLAASAGQQQGDLYANLKEAGIEDAAAPAWLFGAAQGALDIIPEIALANKILPGQVEKELSKSFARGLTKDIGKQTVLEGSTEGAQQALSSIARITSGKDQNWTSEDSKQLLDNIAAGAVVGAITGGGGSIIERLQSKKKQETKNAVPPVSNPNASQVQEPVAGPATAGAPIQGAPDATATPSAPTEVAPNAQPTPTPSMEQAQPESLVTEGQTAGAPAAQVEPAAAAGASAQPVEAAGDAGLTPQIPDNFIELTRMNLRSELGYEPDDAELMARAEQDYAPAAARRAQYAPEEMQQKATSLRDAIERFKTRQPAQGENNGQTETQAPPNETGVLAPTPTAEPEGDLVAQIRDLQDDQNPRRGVYFSPDNIAQNGTLLDGLTNYAKVRNVDGQGGVLVMKARDIAEFRARSAKGEARDALIGEFTLAGNGKPETDNPAVVQQLDANGAVTAESVVDGNDIPAVMARTAEYEQEGRTAEAMAPERAIQRREELKDEPVLTSQPAVEYQDAKTIEEFRDAIEGAEFLKPDFDGPESRLAKAKFMTWLAKSATKEQKDAFRKLRDSRQRGTGEVLMDIVTTGSSDPYSKLTAGDKAVIERAARKIIMGVDSASDAVITATEKIKSYIRSRHGGKDAEGTEKRKIYGLNEYDYVPLSDAEKQALNFFQAFLNRTKPRENVAADSDADFLEPAPGDVLMDILPASQDEKAKLEAYNREVLRRLSPEDRAKIEAYEERNRPREEAVPVDTTAQIEDAEQQLAIREQRIESIVGKGAVIHGTKRVRSAKERQAGSNYKTPEHQAAAWAGQDGDLDAEKMAANLTEADDDSIYQARQVDANEAKERGLAGPGWYVFQYARDPVGLVESNYSKNYGARLSVPQVVMVGLARAKKMWQDFSRMQKSPTNPQQWGVQLAHTTEDGKRKTQMAAAKEITEMGLQADPKLRDIDNYNSRMISGFFHGISLLYSSGSKWVPDTSALPAPRHIIGINPTINRSGSSSVALGSVIGPNTIIAETKGKKITLGNALVKAGGLTEAEKEVIQNLSGREFGAAWNKIVQKRFDNAMRLGAPDAVAKRKAVEQDIAAGRIVRRYEELINAIDKQLSEEKDDAKYKDLQDRRSKLAVTLALAEQRIGSLGYDPSESFAERRERLQEVAEQTDENIYVPPEEVALEHQEGDFVLNRLETEDAQARRSANASYTNDTFNKQVLGNSAIGTTGASGRGPTTAAERVPQGLAPNATPEARQYAAERRAAQAGAQIKPDAMPADGAVINIKDKTKAEGAKNFILALRQFLKIERRIHVTDDLEQHIASLKALGKAGEGALEKLMNDWGKIGSMFGFVQILPNAAFIYIAPSNSPKQFIKTLSHEVGHVLFDEHYANASTETKEALVKAFQAAMDSENPAERASAARGMEEWQSDQLAAWVINNRAARTLVEKYFKSLADIFRKVWAALQKEYPLAGAFDDYLKEIRATQDTVVDGSDALQSLGTAGKLMADTIPNGKVWPREVVNRALAIKAKYKTVDSSLNFIGASAMALHNSLTASLQARIRRMGIPAFNKLLSMFYLRPGESGGFVYESAVENRLRNFTHQFDQILRGLDEKYHDSLHSFLQTEKPAADAPVEIREAVAQFRAFERRMYEYQRDAHMPIRELYSEDKTLPAAQQRGHFPQVADTEELLKEDAIDTLFNAFRAKNIAMDRQAVVDMVANMTDDTFAVDFDPAKLEDAEGNLRSPFQQSLRSRTLPADVREVIQSIKDENGKARFYAKDLRTVMRRYIWQATRRSEFNKLLGDTQWDQQDNGKFDTYRQFKEIVAEAKQQGVTPDQMELMYEGMSAFLGQYNRIKSEPLRQLTRSVTFYQQLRTLPLVVLSNIGEFASLFLNTGNFGATWASVRRSAADAFSKEGKSYETLRLLGYAVDEHDALMFSDVRDAKDFNSTISRASESFFRMIGLTKWTNWMRGVSLNVSMDYMKQHATEIAEGRDESGDSKRRLEELGVTVDDLKTWTEAGEPVYGTRGFTSEDLRMHNSELSAEQLESVRKVTGGLVRMINNIVLDAKAAEKPLWRSDQRFALVTQLGNFAYAFTNRILARAWHELTRDGVTTAQQATIIASMGLMVAITAFGLEIKDLLQYRLWGNAAPSDDLSMPGYLNRVVARSGVLGTMQLGADAAAAAEANKSPLLSFLGPTLSQVSDAFTQPMSKTVPSSIPFLNQVPGVRDSLRGYLKGDE